MKPWQLIVIVLVILLLFGAPKLPGLARSLGESLRIFRKEMQNTVDDQETKAPTPSPASNAAPAPAQAAPSAPAAPAPATATAQSDKAPEPPQS